MGDQSSVITSSLYFATQNSKFWSQDWRLDSQHFQELRIEFRDYK